MPFEGPDQLHLRAAHGYIELKMFEEANAELEEIDPLCRHLPELLVARLAIYHGLLGAMLRVYFGASLDWAIDPPPDRAAVPDGGEDLWKRFC